MDKYIILVYSTVYIIERKKLNTSLTAINTDRNGRICGAALVQSDSDMSECM
jgi:hypothetical protein